MTTKELIAELTERDKQLKEKQELIDKRNEQLKQGREAIARLDKALGRAI